MAAPSRRRHQGGEGPSGPSPAYHHLGEMLEGEFLRELRRIKGWDVDGGLLRTIRWPCDCPLTAVANRLIGSDFGTHDWRLAAFALGLPLHFATAVVRAADNTDTCDQKLRERLLAACEVAP